ncbi:MAG TPA: hypothetical protein VMH30_06240 [Verrucomicrobiae bacterium]|nr:hypothetical protein [Verrucomicrobiae bacterium]
MKKHRKVETAYSDTELLILPNGRILVQNLTQPMAELLRELNPKEKTIALRADKNL